MPVQKLPISRMKQIPNKTTEIYAQFEVGEGESMVELRKTTYADLIRMIVGHVSVDNTIAVMRKDLRVSDMAETAIKEKSEHISLEDSDAAHFLSRFSNFIWPFKHKDLLSFEDDVKTALK